MEDKSLRTNDSVAEVVETYSDMVYKLALARTKNQANAEDVFQEVFLRYMKSSAKIHSEEHRKAWLIRATINCSNSILGSAWFKKTVPLDETLTFSTPEKSDVYYAVLELPVKYRTVIHLFYYENMPVAEISKAIHVNESTIKSQLSRARNLLKTTLKGECDDVWRDLSVRQPGNSDS